MKKYIVGEDLKQGDECIILDNVVHRVENELESEWCKCNHTRTVDGWGKCNYCHKPIKPKRESYIDQTIGRLDSLEQEGRIKEI